MKFFFCGGSNLIACPFSNGNNELILEEHLFSHIVSKFFNAEYINASKSAASNKRTLRKVFYEYDMKDYDLIFIDFTPHFRTEFYDNKEKKWIKMGPNHKYKNTEHERLKNIYYEDLYNEEYGKYMERIEYNIITKYLNALGVNYSTIYSHDCNRCKKWKTVNKSELIQTDYYILDYPNIHSHLTIEGHQAIAQDIIKKYENILQR